MNKLMLAIGSSISIQEVLLCFCLLFLALLGLVTLCQYVINCLTSTFEASCDRLERRLAERKKHRHQPTSPPTPPAQAACPANASQFPNHAVPTTSRKRPMGTNRHLRIVSAQDALRRNAESVQRL